MAWFIFFFPSSLLFTPPFHVHSVLLGPFTISLAFRYEVARPACSDKHPTGMAQERIALCAVRCEPNVQKLW